MGDIYTNPPQSRNEAILRATIDSTEYTDPPQSRIEDLLLELKEAIEEGGGGGTSDYTHLTNKPQINEVTLNGDKSAADLGLASSEDLATKQPKTLDTPITIGGVQRTTVEAALGALEDNKEDTILAATPLVKEYDEVMRQDVLRLTMDTAPTANSGNAVTSGGVKSAVTATVDLLKDTTGWTGKNRFNGKATTKTAQGVMWTVDASDNNIVTVSGTPTGFEAFAIRSSKVLPAGTYKLSGLENVVNVSYNAVRLEKNGVVVRGILGGDVDPLVIEQSDDYDTIAVELKRTTNDVPCSGTAKIMITNPEQYKLSPSYEPYHESVEEEITKLKTSTLRSNAFANNIASGGNLNNYLTPGTYNCQSGSTASGLSNCPTTDAFIMDVIDMNTAGTAKLQVIHTLTKIFKRQYVNDTFSSWYRFDGTAVS